MSSKAMRAVLLGHSIYRGYRWTNKVMKMSDKQVVAVYNSFLRRGLI